MRVVYVAVHVDQARLNNRVAIGGDSVVATRNNVRLEDVIIAQDVLRSADLNQRAKCAAAAKTIGEIFAPAAGSAELNRRRLSGGVTDAASGSRHRAKFVGQFNLHTNPTKFAGQIPDYFTGVRGVTIDVDRESRRPICINTDGGAENFRLSHPVSRYFVLHGDDCAHAGMAGIEDSGRRPGEKTERNEK